MTSQTNEFKAARNATILVKAAVAELQALGASEAEIIADLPRLASAAVDFLRRKAADGTTAQVIA